MNLLRNKCGLMVGVSVLCSTVVVGQSTFQSADYATVGDSVYLTSAALSADDFNMGGTNVTWNYSTLTGTGQRLLKFRVPTQTGFTPAQWPYIQNASNVNLSSTDESTFALGMITYSEPNDYYLISGSLLSQKAVSSKLTIGATNFTLKTVYSSPDVIYHFPLMYGNLPDSSLATFTSSIPNVYYKETYLKRKNTIDAWGTLTTPYGTFTDCIRVNSEIMRIDSMSIDTIAIPADTTYLRELKWMHPSIPYPVLVVKQNLVNGNYVTSEVEYVDAQQFFQPNALFAYLPLAPQVGDTVQFQNLSINAISYSWNFDDPTSAANTSALTNPQHVYTTSGTYQAQLIAVNGPLSDTIVIPVIVSDTLPPVAGFYWLEVPAFVGDSIHFQNTSQYAILSDWDFGDPTSGIYNASQALNPGHVFAQTGVYTIRLIVSNMLGTDTLIQYLTVEDTIQPTASFSWLPDTVFVDDTVFFQNNSLHAIDYYWDFGDPLSGLGNTSMLTTPIHQYAASGEYIVTLIAANTWSSDTLIDTLLVLEPEENELNELNENDELTVYPNPAVDKLFFLKKNGSNHSLVRLYDVIGQCCLEVTTEDQSIDVSMLKTGTYTLVVYGGEGLLRAVFIKK